MLEQAYKDCQKEINEMENLKRMLTNSISSHMNYFKRKFLGPDIVDQIDIRLNELIKDLSEIKDDLFQLRKEENNTEDILLSEKTQNLFAKWKKLNQKIEKELIEINGQELENKDEKVRKRLVEFIDKQLSFINSELY